MYKCIVCSSIVNETDQKFMLAVDKPYINLMVHRECWQIVKGDVAEFLQKNLEKYMKTYNYETKYLKIKRK